MADRADPTPLQDRRGRLTEIVGERGPLQDLPCLARKIRPDLSSLIHHHAGVHEHVPFRMPTWILRNPAQCGHQRKDVEPVRAIQELESA